jgi:hypothetical protein
MMMFRTTRLNRAAALAALAAALALPPAAMAQAPAQAPAQGEAEPAPAEATAEATAPADDPFAPGAFDEGAGLAPDSAPAAKTEYLVGGSALVSASAYLPLGKEGYAATSAASGKLFGKVSVPDYGSLYASYAIYQAFLSARSGEGSLYAAPPADLENATYVMPELHYSFDVGKKVFVRLGKQLLAWGPSRVWSPVDFVNARHADFFAPIDLREGKPGLRLHVPLGQGNAFAFADFSRSSSPEGVGDFADRASYAARLDAPIGGFELGLSGLFGKETQNRAGFDFSGHLIGSAVYGELAFSPAYSDYDRLLQASLGASRALGDLKRWTLSAEGFYNSAGEDLSGDAAALSADPLYSGTWYAYASLAAKELLSPDLGATLSALANFTDGSYMVKLAWDFSFPKSPPFSLALAYYGGGEGKELTYVPGDRSLAATLQTRIEF